MVEFQLNNPYLKGFIREAKRAPSFIEWYFVATAKYQIGFFKRLIEFELAIYDSVVHIDGDQDKAAVGAMF